MRIVKEYNLKIIHADFQIESHLIFEVAKSKAERIIKTFQKNHTLTIKQINQKQ